MLVMRNVLNGVNNSHAMLPLASLRTDIRILDLLLIPKVVPPAWQNPDVILNMQG